MKKLLLAVAAIGILLFSSCEKEEPVIPQKKLESKPISCNCGGGSWD